MTSRMTSEYVDCLDPAERKQYLSKLTLTSGEQLPDPLALHGDWSDDISNLPDLSGRDVTEYLLDTPSVFTKELTKAYKSLEAYNYFTCGHVQDCFHHKTSNESEFSYIKSEVTQRRSSSLHVFITRSVFNVFQVFIQGTKVLITHYYIFQSFSRVSYQYSVVVVSNACC